MALEVAGEQVGADPEQQIDLVDRLGQEVPRTRGQALGRPRAKLRAPAGARSDAD
jgi:hypothetical protein